MNLFLTADVIGTPTGGGAVTYHEAEAFKSLGECLVIDRYYLQSYADKEYQRTGMAAEDWAGDPWCWDNVAHHCLSPVLSSFPIVHIYAGTFSRTVQLLKSRGSMITYTAAAHDKDLSRSEHEKLGLPFLYSHLTEPVLWQRYLAGYLAADVCITPSRHSADVMRQYGFRGRLEVIPHGCHLPERVAPLPERFVVGYLGAIGPDKGLRYLLEAWRDLNYQDGSILLIGGEGAVTPLGIHMLKTYGGAKVLSSCMGNIWQGTISATGWLNDVSDFYNRISLYVQPSVTEGFGIEVLEACAHGRPVIASTGCGASELLPNLGSQFPPMNTHALASLIDLYKNSPQTVMVRGDTCRCIAEAHTWDKISQRYLDLWKSL